MKNVSRPVFDLTIFSENNQVGGVDRFLRSLLDGLLMYEGLQIQLVVNANYVGYSNLERDFYNKVSLTKIPANYAWSIEFKLWKRFDFINLFFRFFLKYCFLFSNAIRISLFLNRYPSKRLMVINGGYPGGDTSRLTNILFGYLNRGKDLANIHNFHNLAVPRKIYFFPLELIQDWALRYFKIQMLSVSAEAVESLRINRKSFSQYSSLGYIYNGVKLKDGVAVRDGEHIITKKIKKFIVLANYELRKGHSFIFKSLELVHKMGVNFRLDCYGAGGGVEYELINVQRDLSPIASKIRLNGFASDVSELYLDADVCLIGSQKFESFGLVAAEAMAHGVPIVSTDAGALPEIIGDAGLVCGRKSVEEFAEAIFNLVSSPEIYQQYSRKGVERVSLLYDKQLMVKRYMQALDIA